MFEIIWHSRIILLRSQTIVSCPWNWPTFSQSSKTQLQPLPTCNSFAADDFQSISVNIWKLYITLSDIQAIFENIVAKSIWLWKHSYKIRKNCWKWKYNCWIELNTTTNVKLNIMNNFSFSYNVFKLICFRCKKYVCLY